MHTAKHETNTLKWCVPYKKNEYLPVCGWKDTPLRPHYATEIFIFSHHMSIATETLLWKCFLWLFISTLYINSSQKPER